MYKQIANFLSFLRFFLIFPILFLLEQDNELLTLLALFIFIFAALTDFLDGYWARKSNTVSTTGALLDLLADKLLVSILLIYFLTIYKSTIYLIPILLIVSRELIIASVRQHFSQMYKDTSPNYIGKSKTFLHLFTIIFLILSTYSFNLFSFTSIILLWLSAIISFYSLFHYFYKWK